jgi:hypothetical protein
VNGEPALLDQTIIQRQVNRGASGVVAYPWPNSTHRVRRRICARRSTNRSHHGDLPHRARHRRQRRRKIWPIR